MNEQFSESLSTDFLQRIRAVVDIFSGLVRVYRTSRRSVIARVSAGCHLLAVELYEDGSLTRCYEEHDVRVGRTSLMDDDKEVVRRIQLFLIAYCGSDEAAWRVDDFNFFNRSDARQKAVT